MPIPTVAIVGRPNVGKSTLVNRIVGRREAIVEEEPGVTRDRKILEADWNGRDFLVVDTGGWMAANDGIDAQVSRQAERAIAEADVVLLVVDATVGVTEEDDRVAALLRRHTRSAGSLSDMRRTLSAQPQPELSGRSRRPARRGRARSRSAGRAGSRSGWPGR